MILNIDKHPKESVAAIDSTGEALLYGDLISFSEYISPIIPARSLVFMLTRNNIGGVAWSIGMINTRVVPLLLNVHIETSLFEQLYNKYTPQFICLPEEDALGYKFKEAARGYGYLLLRTENQSYPLYEELSHLLPTSGSTGSPKLIRHSFANIAAIQRKK